MRGSRGKAFSFARLSTLSDLWALLTTFGLMTPLRPQNFSFNFRSSHKGRRPDAESELILARRRSQLPGL